ncbi:hypothetical protein JNM87_03875 [Candidatus Saccharibacteria bacterium]|nr:hypothetical protein [Candidatus Saccharibacteria bacterium]
MKHIHELSPKTIGIATGVMLAGAALSGCAGGGDAAPKPTSIAAETHAITPTPEVSATKSAAEIALMKKEAIERYTKSDERNQKVAKAVQAMGMRVVLNGGSALGYFDFYNPDKDNWKSKVSPAQNEGWGYLQHNPQYGGSRHQAAVTVYRDSDGGFNTKKGVSGLALDIPGTNLAVEFDAPVDPTFDATSQDPKAGWEVSIIDLKKLENQDPGYRSSVGGGLPTAQSAKEAKALDAQAITLAEQALYKLGM